MSDRPNLDRLEELAGAWERGEALKLLPADVEDEILDALPWLVRAARQRDGHKNTLRMRLKWGRQQRQRAEHAEKQLRAAEAQVAELREALKKIAGCRCETGWGDGELTNPPPCDCVVCTARAALASSTGEER